MENRTNATNVRQVRTMEEKEIKQAKKGGAFKRFIRAVFVNNVWYKLFAIGFGTLMWLLVVGFNI